MHMFERMIERKERGERTRRERERHKSEREDKYIGEE